MWLGFLIRSNIPPQAAQEAAEEAAAKSLVPFDFIELGSLIK